MAFSVSYNDKKRSPYNDWISHGCPAIAAFRYTQHAMADDYTLIFDPTLNALFIDINCEYWTMTAIASVHVDSVAKKLRITGASCKAANHWPLMNGIHCPHGEGNSRFMRRALGYFADLDLLKTVASTFFGQEWAFIMPIKRGRLHDTDLIISTMCKWDDSLYCTKPQWGRATAYFDRTDIEGDAATRIQAAFRGWKVRMKYRYSPYNRLGKYVILRDAGFNMDQP